MQSMKTSECNDFLYIGWYNNTTSHFKTHTVTVKLVTHVHVHTHVIMTGRQTYRQTDIYKDTNQSPQLQGHINI
jgi:hypothetical protein